METSSAISGMLKTSPYFQSLRIDRFPFQPRQIARMIGIPESIIAKPPSAGLWEGQTDESEMGIMYEDLDRILYGMEDGMSDQEIASETGIDRQKVSEIRAQVKLMEHKRLPAKRPEFSRLNPSCHLLA